MSAWLTAIFGRILNTGTSIPLGYGINFAGALQARLNTSTKFIDADVRSASLAPSHHLPEASGVGSVFVLRIAMTAGVAGTADDVAGPAAPVALRIINRWADVTTAIGASTLTVRNAAAGAGDTLSGTISAAAIGEGIHANSTTIAAQTALAAGAIPYVRRSDRGVAGTVYLLCVRTS